MMTIIFLSQRWILLGIFAAILFPIRSVSGVLDLSYLTDLEPLEFHLPTVTDPNVTENIVGYNPWMPRYQGSADPSKPTIVLMTGGCLPVEEGGSDFYQDARRGFYDECAKFGDVQCQCRPIIDPSKWQPKEILGLTDETIFNGIVECKWEIRRLLDEHKKGLINVAGISAKCSFDQPELFDELREHNIPIFLMGVNQPFPDEPEYNVPQPTGFLGTDQAFLGKTLARLLVQLRPEGGRFATMLNWGSTGMVRRRYGFLQEISKDADQGNQPRWREIEEYPFNTSIRGFGHCPYMECMLERLGNPVYGAKPDAIIFFFQSPIRKDNFTYWVDSYAREQNITLISMDALSYSHYLAEGYLDGLVGQLTYEMGKRSANVLREITLRGLGGPDGVQIPPDTRLFETRLVSYNLIPLDLDKVYPRQFEENLLGKSTIVGYVLFGVVIVTALLCLAWTIWNRNAMVVRAAQPFFLLVLLSGIEILSCAMIPLSFDDNGEPESITETFAVGICMSVPWLAFSGLSVIFAALFSKTWRVNKLFHASSSLTRIEVSKTDVLMPFAVVFTCNVVVLACWTALDPLTYVRQIGEGTDVWNREIESYGACRSDKALAFLCPLAFINFAVVAIACWQAFEGRKIESEFAESKYIMLSVASLIQAFLTGVPIAVIVMDDPEAFYLVMTLMIFCLCEVILLLIFLPKMVLAWKYAGMSESEQRKQMLQVIKASRSSHKVSFGELDDSSSGNQTVPFAKRIRYDWRAKSSSVLSNREAVVAESSASNTDESPTNTNSVDLPSSEDNKTEVEEASEGAGSPQNSQSDQGQDPIHDSEEEMGISETTPKSRTGDSRSMSSKETSTGHGSEALSDRKSSSAFIQERDMEGEIIYS